MGILGSLGQLYMFVLLVLVFVGSGLAIWSLISFIIKSRSKITALGNKAKENIQQDVKTGTEINKKMLGGLIMANNGWFKLAVFSFVGILISMAVLGLMSSNGIAGQHNAHVGMNMQGNMNGSMNMGSMNMPSSTPMTGGMNGMNMGGTSMQGNMPMSNDMMMLQQQMNQLQMQLNALQQQMGQMNGGNMQGGMNNSMPMQGGGSMNMGGMM